MRVPNTIRVVEHDIRSIESVFYKFCPTRKIEGVEKPANFEIVVAPSISQLRGTSIGRQKSWKNQRSSI